MLAYKQESSLWQHPFVNVIPFYKRFSNILTLVLTGKPIRRKVMWLSIW